MGTTTSTTDFKATAKHHDELGDRQLEVLALIADGLSNSEIAQSTGLALDETKLNVSAVISKLGLANRDEAADYYRWRQRPGRKVVRNAGVLAAGVACVAVAVVVALAVWPRGESGTPGAYYLEFVSEYDNTSALTVGTNADDEEPDLEGEPAIVHTVTRQWFEPPNKWRMEIDAPDGEPGFVVIFDGSDVTFFHPVEDSYFPARMQAAPGWEGVLWFPLLAPIGRVPGENADEFLSISKTGKEETVLRHTGRLDGRTVVIIEQRHWDTCIESDCNINIRFWLDEERMLVLRAEVWPGPERRMTAAEVTVFDDNVTHDPALFEFVPAPGATEQSASEFFETTAKDRPTPTP